jgi:SAM-dependent methyltransferase
VGLAALPEERDELDTPVYGPYRFARSLLGPESRVLDVGCGNAKVSAYLAGSGALVDGIEPTASRARVAAGRLRHVSVVPAGQDDPALLREYDLITFFDVIEHLSDPAPTLDWAVTRLAPRGRILASIPNSAHWSFRLKVARGDWTMADWGLFDRTHLHFYDPSTMRSLQPKSTREVGQRFFAPDATGGWRAVVLRAWPRLFALHCVLVWERMWDSAHDAA